MSGSTAPATVLHVAPHADDELIGAPAALMALRDASWRVVNLTCSLGATAHQDRRRGEVTEACRRAGFVSEILEPPLPDPLEPRQVPVVRRRLAHELAIRLQRLQPVVVVAPSPHDRHPGHEVVGRAVLDAWPAAGAAGPGGAADDRPPRLWLWGLWADLPFPSLLVGFGEERLGEILAALGAHGGELARNDYRRLVRGRAEMNAALGPERVFGFGSAGAGASYVEVLCELGLRQGAWHMGQRRWLDPRSPLGGVGEQVLGDWLHAPSLTDRFGTPGGRPA